MNNTALKDSETKQSIVETPRWLAKIVYDKTKEIIDGCVHFKDSFAMAEIADFCCGNGAMSFHFSEYENVLQNYDINHPDSSSDLVNFSYVDLLEYSPLGFSGCFNIIIMNPPFNDHVEQDKKQVKNGNIVNEFVKAAFRSLLNHGFLVLLAPYNFFFDGHLTRWKGIEEREIGIFKCLSLPVHSTFKRNDEKEKEYHDIHACLMFLCRKKDLWIYKDFHETDILNKPEEQIKLF